MMKVTVCTRFGAQPSPAKQTEAKPAAQAASEAASPGQTFFTPNPFPLTLAKPKGRFSFVTDAFNAMFRPWLRLNGKEQKINSLLDQFSQALKENKVEAQNPNPEFITGKSNSPWFLDVQLNSQPISIGGQSFRFEKKWQSGYYTNERYAFATLSKESPRMELKLDIRNENVILDYKDKNLSVTTANKYLYKKTRRVVKQYLKFFGQVAEKWKQKLNNEQLERENKMMGTLVLLERALNAGQVLCQNENPPVGQVKTQTVSGYQIGPVDVQIEGKTYAFEKLTGKRYGKIDQYYHDWIDTHFVQLTSGDGFVLKLDETSSQITYKDKGIDAVSSNPELLKQGRAVLNQFTALFERMDEIRTLKKEMAEEATLNELSV